MNQTDGIPWNGLGIVAFTVAVITVSAFVLTALALCVIEARKSLRDRYVGGNRGPQPVDILGVPTGLALEVLCLLTGVLLFLLMARAACTAARDFRDWWHQGGRGR